MISRLARPMFIDEAWTGVSTIRFHDRHRKGYRPQKGFSHEYRNTTSLAAALRMTGMATPISGYMSDAHIAKVLVPELHRSHGRYFGLPLDL